MKINWKSVGIFVAGSVVGGIISAVVTRNVVDKVYRDAADEAIAEAWKESKKRQEGLKGKLKEANEKITRQNVLIQSLTDQVRACGGVPTVPEDDGDETEDDIRPSVPKSDGQHGRTKRETERALYEGYAGRYRRSEPAEAEFPPDDKPDPEELEDEIARRGPVVISEDEFAQTCMDYGKEDIRFYMYDGKMISEDGEYVDEPGYLVGWDWKLHGRNAGDEVYVRNDNLHADYRIIFTAGAGEESISHTDVWD